MQLSHSISVAVAGSGPVAEYHLKRLQINHRTRPCGIFSHNRKRVDKLVRDFKVKPYGSMDEMVRDVDVDAVDICNGNHNHFRTAKIALNAGKHVIVEKPVAFRSGEIAELVDIASSRGQTACAVLQKRYNKTLQIVRDFIQSQEEKILYTQSFIYLPRNRKYYHRPEKSTIELAGGGALIYQAIHDLDLLIWMFGGVETVLPLCTNFYHSIDVEDTCFALLKFKCGTVSYLHTSTIPSLPLTGLHIFCARNRFMVFDNVRVGIFPNIYLNKWQKYWRDSGRLEQIWFRLSRIACFEKFFHPMFDNYREFQKRLIGIRYFGPYAPGSYSNVVDNFIDEIQEISGKCITSLSSTIETHRIVEKIYGT